MRGLAFASVLVIALIQATAADAHASLLHSDPAEGAILLQSPRTLKLTFNEPVAPLVVRLIGPSGELLSPLLAANNAVLTITPPALAQGTQTLSWRVISADGHPVGGSLSFSIGAPSRGPLHSAQTADANVTAVLWAMKVVIYAGLFIGIGGIFFRVWLSDPVAAVADDVVARVLRLTLIAGLSATIVSVGLQGLDALAKPLSSYLEAGVWRTGLATAYGVTAVAEAIAIALAIAAQIAHVSLLRRGLAAAALIGAGLALSLSGHAGTVEPRYLTRTAVFLHGICVASWVGAFIPLLAEAGRPTKNDELLRFTRFIPYPLVLLVLSGAALAFVQLDRIDALWTTQYGILLSAKLAVVCAMLVLGAANRFVLVPRFEAIRGFATLAPLGKSIGFELALALSIFAIVAGWRFTPPPRALTSGEHVSAHFHGERAMTQIEMDPHHGRGLQVDVQVLNPEMHPLAAQGLTLLLSDPAGRMEPIRRRAMDRGGGNWRIDDLVVPLAGIWRLRVDILINDFEKETLEDRVDLPRAP